MTTEMPSPTSLLEDAMKILALTCIRLFLCRYTHLKNPCDFKNCPYSRTVLAFLWMYCMLFMHLAWFIEVISINKLNHFFINFHFRNRFMQAHRSLLCSNSIWYTLKSKVFLILRWKIRFILLKWKWAWCRVRPVIKLKWGGESLTLEGGTGMCGTQDPLVQGPV